MRESKEQVLGERYLFRNTGFGFVLKIAVPVLNFCGCSGRWH